MVIEEGGGSVTIAWQNLVAETKTLVMSYFLSHFILLPLVGLDVMFHMIERCLVKIEFL